MKRIFSFCELFAIYKLYGAMRCKDCGVSGVTVKWPWAGGLRGPPRRLQPVAGSRRVGRTSLYPVPHSPVRLAHPSASPRSVPHRLAPGRLAAASRCRHNKLARGALVYHTCRARSNIKRKLCAFQ